MNEGTSISELIGIARQVRRLVLQTAHTAGAGHVGGSLSAAEQLTALYFKQMRIDPADPDAPNRDRFILSKGHCGLGLYVTLALRGYFPVFELDTFDANDTRLQMHPDMHKLPGLDMSTGSLGQGLSVGIGMALAARRTGSDAHTYVLMGDGELQEGMAWEALHTAPRYGLDNLTAILDHNRQQQYGYSKEDDGGVRRHLDPWAGVDLAAVAASLGWHVHHIDGHDMGEVVAALEHAPVLGKPTLVISRTVKGKGVSFMEGVTKWHTGGPTVDELSLALAGLEGE